MKERKLSKQQQIWNAMRVLKRFDLKKIKLCLEDEANTKLIRTYISKLITYGYVIRVNNDFFLRKNTGPKAPNENINGLKDRNIGKVTPSPRKKTPFYAQQS